MKYSYRMSSMGLPFVKSQNVEEYVARHFSALIHKRIPLKEAAMMIDIEIEKEVPPGTMDPPPLPDSRRFINAFIKSVLISLKT